MTKLSLRALARELAKRAAEAPSGRAAETVYGGHERRLRQTVIALRAGESLSEHVTSGEATLIVLTGSLWLVVGENRWYGRDWTHLVLPAEVHHIEAETDTTFVLSVVTRH